MKEGDVELLGELAKFESSVDMEKEKAWEEWFGRVWDKES